ncbi:MAG: hypothetical protein K2K91_06000 [Ruminococcus sp.]|nr:hypothetical protein [Ruminococcus sp.]
MEKENQKENNSNKCVNTPKIEVHTYTIGDINFTVRLINKNQNPEAVLKRLKQVAINHMNIEN